MRVVRLLLKPGFLVTLVTVAAVVAVTRSVPGALGGLAGALVGGLAAVAASQLGLLASVVVAGVTVQRLVVGVGPRVADWSTPHRIVSLRALPIMLSVSVRATRSPVRVRIWVAALCALGFEVALAVTAILLLATGPFTRGFALATVASLVLSLIPKRTATTTSTGWLLFSLPRAGNDIARQMEAAPMIGNAVAAAQAGDLVTAERLAAHLRETYPDLRPALAARISVLEAQGRYAEAMILAVKLTSDSTSDPQQAASSFAALAGLACATVEAGQLDPELGLSTASQAIENAATLGYPNHKLNGARAMVELLRGNLKDAIALARLAAGAGDDLLARADDLATLAKAHMAAGDNRTAREVIGEAEKLAKWWPRVANTRIRLEVAG
ncbi:tetratricopeptide repeat protein [Actinophytocola sp.]|uniref:tetratricopeptide repeat protein n=1 Tax=Actinophytocola sp. TaxID=1872138 RepID=UPI00389A18FB